MSGLARKQAGWAAGASRGGVPLSGALSTPLTLPPPASASCSILGYPKCATTSLAAWLDSHPQAVASNPKEPEFFSYFGKCAKPGKPWHCDRAAERRYILHTMQRDAAVESGLTQAHFEASTGYSWVRRVDGWR